MIKREDLKKGDHVLEVKNNWGGTDVTYDTSELVVVSIGKQYFSCQHVDSKGNAYGNVKKYHKVGNMCLKDWSQWKLFLGTREEYIQELENRKKCNDLYRQLDQSLHRDLGYEKLKAIKTIIEADTLDDALAEMHCVRLPR